MIIPKLIHQIHFGEESYKEQFKDNIELVKKLNPEYSYRLWTETDANELLLARFPEYWTYYKNLSILEKSDFFRYVLMFFFGGVYFDLDMCCHKSLDDFFSYNKIFYRTLRGVTSLPTNGTVENLNFYKYDVILTGENYINNGESYVNNFCLMSRAGHPFWKKLLDIITMKNFGSVYEKTGYKILTKTLVEFVDRNDILVLPPFYFGWGDSFDMGRPAWVIASHNSPHNTFKKETRYLHRTGILAPKSDIYYPWIKIGIAVTTVNRPQLLAKCLQAFQEKSASLINVKYVVVDDASTAENQKINRTLCANHNFEYFVNSENLGIAKSKNKCFELLDDCDYIFLADDDCYPIETNWWDLFIDTSLKTGIPHFCVSYTHFENGWASNHILEPLWNINGCNLDVFNSACGIFMFYTNSILQKTGGMDINYTKWGGEHVGLSFRISNLLDDKLKGRITCPEHAFNYFKSHDFHGNAASSISKQYRKESADQCKFVLDSEKNTKSFKPYKRGNYILTTYLTQGIDPQRGLNWKLDDEKVIKTWAESLAKNDLTGIVLHDGLSKDFINQYSNESVKFHEINYDNRYEPSAYRWLKYEDFLTKFSYYIDSVFFTDVSDVEILKNPFTQPAFTQFSADHIFCGDEPDLLDSPWMNLRLTGFSKFVEGYRNFYEKNKKQTLLNAGIFGGKLDLVFPLVKQLARLADAVKYNNFNTDMPIFNFILRNSNVKIIHGSPVNTVFKKYETDNPYCWFKHK